MSLNYIYYSDQIVATTNNKLLVVEHVCLFLVKNESRTKFTFLLQLQISGLHLIGFGLLFSGEDVQLDADLLFS